MKFVTRYWLKIWKRTVHTKDRPLFRPALVNHKSRCRRAWQKRAFIIRYGSSFKIFDDVCSIMTFCVTIANEPHSKVKGSEGQTAQVSSVAHARKKNAFYFNLKMCHDLIFEFLPPDAFSTFSSPYLDREKMSNEAFCAHSSVCICISTACNSLEKEYWVTLCAP